jgi:hypothetical protein
MKTTLDLPAELVKQVKLRALDQGQKLKDAIADLLRKGLATSEASAEVEGPVVVKDKKTGLPLIVCKQSASPETELTPQRVADILLTQEAGWHYATGR